jgi:exodeoxyribonuclease VII small subunit
MAGRGKEREPSFEEAMKGLEEVVARLESGETPLEESIRLFEEGMKLSEVCRKRLDEADRKIELLLRRPGGVVTDTEDEGELSGKEE